jgi:hypothetical protein
MRDAPFGGWASWVVIGVLGYVTGVRFFEVITGIGLAILIFYEAVGFLGHDGLPDQDQPHSK